MRPLRDWVLVKRTDPETKTRGGLIIPEQAQERSIDAIVLAVGPGRITEHGKLIDSVVKKGDRVLIARHSGIEIELDRVKHLVVRESEIMGVVGE